MLSLRQVIAETVFCATDFGEKKPMMDKARESLEAVSSSSTRERIRQAFKSRFQPQILWGLNAFVKNREVSLLSDFLRFFTSEDRVIELIAIGCAKEIADAGTAKEIAGAVIARLDVFPAVEYAECLGSTLSYLDPKDLETVILPRIQTYFTRNESFQHAASIVLKEWPFQRVRITPNVIEGFLNSHVFIAQYLADVLKRGSFDMNWRRNGLPSALMPGVNSHPELREGAIRAILGGMPNVEGNGIHIFVMAAFSWMATSEVIGMALLEHSSALLAKKSPEYYTKLREMAIRIAHCHSAKLRVALPGCLAKNKAVFEGSKAGLKAVMKVMMTDTEPRVRVAFLKNYLAYDTIFNSPPEKDEMLRMFMPFFNDTSPLVHAFLAGCLDVYLSFGAQLKTVIPSFIRVIGGLQKWRLVQKGIQTFMNLPDDVVAAFGRQMLIQILEIFEKWPSPLMNRFLELLSRVLGATPVNKKESVVISLERLRSPEMSHHMRTLLAKAAPIISPAVSYPVFMSDFWPIILALTSDQVPVVRAAAVETILSLRNFFKQRNDTGAVQQAEARFMDMRKDPDPYVREKWTDCKNQYQASKQVRRSLPAMLPTLLPASAEPTDLKKRKVVPKPAATPMKAKSRTSYFIPRAPGRGERTLSMRLSGTKCMRL